MKSKALVVFFSTFFLFACNGGSQQSVAKHEIPEPESAGGKVFANFCGDCHAPPRIASHKADEWPNIVERMQNHRLQKAYHLLTDTEKETLLAYLKKHSV